MIEIQNAHCTSCHTKTSSAKNKKEKSNLILAILLTLPVFVLGMLAPMFEIKVPGSLWIQAVLTSVVIMYCGNRFFISAWKNAQRKSFNMDTLVALGSGAAFGYSIIALFIKDLPLYFDSAAMIITFILLGNFLETRSKREAGRALQKLLELKPVTARVIRNYQELDIPIENLRKGDICIVLSGEKIPSDGVVVEGYSYVNEAMVTGESMPVEKKSGDTVIGTTLNGEGVLKIHIEKIGDQTIYAQIIKCVEQIQTSKAPIQRVADRMATYFVPSVIAIAILTLGFWWIQENHFIKGFLAAISVLLIACPCALGLATPIAVMVGSGKAALWGILFKNASVLETIGKISVIGFDKTGTLTEGKYSVLHFSNRSSISTPILLGKIASIEKKSHHPLAKALVLYAKQIPIRIEEASHVQTISGFGLSGIIAGQKWLMGNLPFMKQEKIEFDPQLFESPSKKTEVYVACDQKLLAYFSLTDTTKEGALGAIAYLKSIGIIPILMTGDTKDSAISVATHLEIDHVYSQLTPTEKVEKIKELQWRTTDRKIVAMVGDGINDAPALMASDLGIAIGTGTDIAMEAANVILIHGDIQKVAQAIHIGKTTLKIIKQNLFLALMYNALMIPVAAFGHLNPMIAAACMSLSSLSVVFNSLRLQKTKPLHVRPQ